MGVQQVTAIPGEISGAVLMFYKQSPDNDSLEHFLKG